MKLAREETKIMVTGSSFYRKNNLKFKGRNRNLNRGKKIGTRNRNLGKMARFRNTVYNSNSTIKASLAKYQHKKVCVPLDVPVDGGVVHLVDKDDEMFHTSCLHQHSVLSRLQIGAL